MSFKAELKVILKANDTVVAESVDPDLWQKVLTAISSGESANKEFSEDPKVNKKKDVFKEIDKNDSDKLKKFAQELEIDEKLLVGACSPETKLPFIHLDKHHWEAISKNKGKIANMVIAATLLVLWKDSANLGDTLSKEVAAVLNTIGVTQKNPTRSINNCEWLQLRNGKIIINPAKTSQAIKLAKAYCLKTNLTEI